MSNIHDHLYPLRTLACNLIKQIIFLGKACPIRGDASRRGFEGGGKVSKLFLFQPQFFQGDKQLFWKVMAKRSNKSVTSSLDTKRQADKDGHSWPPVVLNKSTVSLFIMNKYFHLSDAFCFFSLGPHMTLYLHSYSMQRLSKAGLQRRHLRKLTSETDWPPNSLLLLYFTSWG